MWFGQGELDKRLVESFKKTVTCEMLSDLSSPKKYGVARTVLGHGPKKYKILAEMLNSYRNTDMTRGNIPCIIEREVANMRKAYRKGPRSAITKSFWMMKQHPIVIYDGNTWEGLRRRGLAPGDGYRTYFDSWFKFFDDHKTQEGLDDALTWLAESPAARKIAEEAKAVSCKKEQEAVAEIGTLIKNNGCLMRNRVTDMRLFYEGGGYLEAPLSCSSQSSCR